MPVLDTNLLIALAHQDPRAEAALDALAPPHIVPAHVAMEYLAGIEDPVAEMAALRGAFLVQHPNDLVLLEAARIRARARPKGVKPRWGDIMVAAHAAIEGTFVATNNTRHFRQLDVPCWHWPGEAEPPTS